MKLGAQFFSIRDKTQTPKGIKESFEKMKATGYDIAQMSAIGPIAPELLRDFTSYYELPIVCTHSSPDRIINDTKALIREHLIYGCPTVGIGSMPTEYRESADAVRAFIKDYREAAKMINDAGLRFAYHNHAFEFDDLGGVNGMTLLIEEFPECDFILDTYWVKYGGHDYLKMIRDLGPARIKNVHFKDMKTEPKGEICPCGTGTIDFAPVVKLCDELGIVNALVEQDNAPASGDSYGQLAISYENLKGLFAK
ncbi:MAG: sugar phosphate isomerase/epimerase [Clostridia bacterium]|nr:sugar phosphate isomerase/epimerase [Clostridia bacterium]